MAINPLQLPQQLAPMTFDFSGLGKLGKVYKDAYYEAEAPGLIAGALSRQQPGQPASLSAIGQRFQPQEAPQAAPSAAASNPDKDAFIAKYSPIAEEASKRTGVDARLILAQAGLETGWGKSMPGNNLFGIKSHGLPGGNVLPTSEVVDGQSVRTTDSFRAYASPEESGAGYADFILKNPRYAGVRNAQGLDAQAEALGRSGYATDPEYGSKVGTIARSLPTGPHSVPNGDVESPLDVAQWPHGPNGAPGSGLTDVSAQSRPRALPGNGDASGSVSREQLLALAANPNTRALAFQLIQRQMDPGKYGFQAVGDQLVRTNDRTGAAEVVPGVRGKANVEVKELNGRLIAYDKDARTSTDVTPKDLPNGFRPATPEERAAYGVSADKPFFFGADGKPATLNSGTTVNVDQKGEGKFKEEFGKHQAKRWGNYIEAADKARGQLVDISSMREISARLGSQGQMANAKEALGPYAEALGINIDGLSDIQAYSSIIQRLAPQQRAEGSGSTSDIEFKGFLKSLPTLSQNPVAREMTLNTMEALQRDAIARGDIATRLANDEISRADAEKGLRALGDPMKNFTEWRKANPGLYGQALKGSGTGSAAPAAKAEPKPSSPADASQSISNARAAIAAGKDRGIIIKMLRDAGIEPPGDL